jgi:hypothetical protein
VRRRKFNEPHRSTAGMVPCAVPERRNGVGPSTAGAGGSRRQWAVPGGPEVHSWVLVEEKSRCWVRGNGYAPKHVAHSASPAAEDPTGVRLGVGAVSQRGGRLGFGVGANHSHPGPLEHKGRLPSRLSLPNTSLQPRPSSPRQARHNVREHANSCRSQRRPPTHDKPHGATVPHTASDAPARFLRCRPPHALPAPSRSLSW